jgi:hypothetical protein
MVAAACNDMDCEREDGVDSGPTPFTFADMLATSLLEIAELMLGVGGWDLGRQPALYLFVCLSGSQVRSDRVGASSGLVRVGGGPPSLHRSHQLLQGVGADDGRVMWDEGQQLCQSC